MMRKTIDFLCVFSLATLAAAGSAALYLAPALVVPTPVLAAGLGAGRQDPAPQRLELAQSSEVGVVASTLPGGASSLDETYEDWRVSCVHREGAKRCVLSQVQAQQNGQRILAVELDAPRDETVSGVMILPFGLALEAGVIFQVDENAATEPVRFRTCLPAGCLVPVAFDASTVEVLRSGVALKITATTADGGGVPLSVSLKGFPAALDRAAELSGSQG